MIFSRCLFWHNWVPVNESNSTGMLTPQGGSRLLCLLAQDCCCSIRYYSHHHLSLRKKTTITIPEAIVDVNHESDAPAPVIIN
jgi:hypothetical protein